MEGFSLEFAVFNPLAFFFYAIYNIAGFIDYDIGAGQVDPNDLVFAIHAFLLSSIQLMQTFIYYRGKDKDKFAKWGIALMTVLCITVVVMSIVSISGVKLPIAAGPIRFFGYGKAVITFVKYLPQVYLNWSRKSTVGWSIENVILDFTGGSFSLL